MPDSLTAEQIGAEHRADLIKELAHRLFPEDGHESDDENRQAELFTLMCQATYLYAADGTPGKSITENDMWCALQGLAENMTLPDGTTFRVVSERPAAVSVADMQNELRPVGFL